MRKLRTVIALYMAGLVSCQVAELRRKSWLLALPICMGLTMPVARATADARVGEFSIPSVSPLTDVQLGRLRRLVAEHPEAWELGAAIKQAAVPLLAARPNPLEVIHYEGLVNTDPRRIATVAQLREMGDIARLVRYWQISSDPKAAETILRFITAWTQTYRLTGNDVNENKFYPLLVAWYSLRTSVAEVDRRPVDNWVRRLGELHHEAVRDSTHFTNRYSKHVRLLAICGMILDRAEWRESAHAGIKRFVRHSLFEDGTSRDLKRRDTLTYHCSSLKPPLELAMLAGDKGKALYAWTSPQGGSIQKSVQYVVPFALGQKTRREWVNSKVGLDHRRAATGLEHYRPGTLYDPHNALELMEKAAYFEPNLMRVVLHLSEGDAKRFPSWQTLINAAVRKGQN